MAKTIEEDFPLPLDKHSGKVFITARNYNDHWLKHTWAGKYGEFPLTIEQMRMLGNHLLSCADKIEADPDFNKKD